MNDNEDAECIGNDRCPAPVHVHGCYTPHRADQCDAPNEFGHLPDAPVTRPDLDGLIARLRQVSNGLGPIPVASKAADALAAERARADQAEQRIAEVVELRRYKGPRPDGSHDTLHEAHRVLVQGIDRILFAAPTAEQGADQ